MGVTIPNPGSVEADLIATVCDHVDDKADVEIRSCDNDRPGVLRVESGTVHELPGFDVVGVSVTDDYTLVHVQEDS